MTSVCCAQAGWPAASLRGVQGTSHPLPFPACIAPSHLQGQPGGRVFSTSCHLDTGPPLSLLYLKGPRLYWATEVTQENVPVFVS